MSKFLVDNKLEAYGKVFADNGLTGSDLLDLTHDDLKSMAIDRCTDRKAVLRCESAAVML